MTRSIFIALACTFAALSVAAQPAIINAIVNADKPTAIPDQYIVVFKQDASRADVAAAEQVVKKLGGSVGFRYTTALIGFSARLPAGALNAVRANKRVAYIEADQKLSLDTVEVNPPTGLDRTSERLLPLDNRFTYSETGAGVHAYVIDSGIRATHLDFGGRVTGGVDEVMDGHGTDDCYHHGTHVSGILGGTTYGIAKLVNLHPVRVADCTGTLMPSRIIAGVDWVTANATFPAVINMSLHTPVSPSLDTSVTNAINAGIVVVASTGNAGLDACTISPAHLPAVIAVGSVDPTTDASDPGSGIGTCVDLFAPGVNILSDWNTGDVATHLDSGTSMATPHVAGVAALYLQNHIAATPAAVWAAIHHADDVSTTPGWAGIGGLAAGTPNELLHWGSLNDGYNDGDPHLITVDGVHYNFQSAGEFVTLRDGDGLEIQTRQTPVSTTFDPGPDPYDGLATCVSLNTAVAARVGKRRVTYQPNINGVPDPNGLQLRVDGALTTLGAQGLDLGSGGRVVNADGGGIDIYFPDGTILAATPGWWSSQNKWYLNVHIYRTRASDGIMGAIAAGSWLPALPNGASIGAMPGSLHERYVDLNGTFADAWRVRDAKSLFDYAPGTSTATFTFRDWPPEKPPCVFRDSPRATPADPREAEKACAPITIANLKADCIFDVTVTGELGFATTYLRSQRIQLAQTITTIEGEPRSTLLGQAVSFTATVTPLASNTKDYVSGAVQFIVDGEKAGPPVRLGSNGRAVWKTSQLRAGTRRVAASYVPSAKSPFQASRSLDEFHKVTKQSADRPAYIRN